MSVGRDASVLITRACPPRRRTVVYDSATELAVAEFIGPGDTVAWGQATAEPRSLTEALVGQRATISGARCFLGMPAATAITADCADHLRFASYTGAGVNATLHAAGALDVLPCHYSELLRALSTGPARVDVALLLLPEPFGDGTYSLGLAAEYLPAIIRQARCVIAEVSPHVPQTSGTPRLRHRDLDALVRSDRPPADHASLPSGAVETAIARQVSELVDDGATVQMGAGRLPDAVLAGLAGHRRLGVHSGLITDTVADLMEADVVSNQDKTADRGVTVAGLLMGTARLRQYAHRHDRIHLRATEYTHHPGVLAGQNRFTAINAALEVDLFGQINAESIAGRYRGAVGGALDFLRAAHASAGGLPITVLPSTAGPASRVVARLSGPATVPRADAGIVVTEYGWADLRRQTLRQRAEALLPLAHPDHRATLAAQADAMLRSPRASTEQSMEHL
jgi:acyl-CoA hydrolase